MSLTLTPTPTLTRPEARSMLDARLFDGASVALKPGGTLTIVTDNAWCGRTRRQCPKPNPP